MNRFSTARRFFVGALPLGLLLLVTGPAQAPDASTRASDRPCTECCTSLLVGPDASVDGSTMTSHSCDSGTDRTWIALEPRKSHEAGSMAALWLEPKRTTRPNDPDRISVGEIPQVAETFKFMDAAYPIMNEHQLAIGETTTGGKGELRSTEGLIDAPELYRLVLERATNAREAIRIADELTKEFGYNDWGECFTFADPKEVWFFEILGPGRGKIGAVWAAVRLPDDHIAVSANAHRILELDLNDPDHYMASGQRLLPGGGDGVVGSGKRGGVPLRLCLRGPKQPLFPPQRVEGVEPPGPLPGARSQLRELPALGEAGREGHRAGSADHLQGLLRRHTLRHDPATHGGEPRGGDRQEPGGQPLHERRSP